jgi:phosphoribosylformylglycinamidine (FGAM) synthase-like enzyme
MPPVLDLARERALQSLIVALAAERLVRSAHDCSDGGIAVTLAECCFGTDGMGAEVSLDSVEVAREARTNEAAALFSETASRIVVSTTDEDLVAVLERAAAASVPARVIGRTGGNRLRIAIGGQTAVDVSIDDAERIWSTAIESAFTKRVA